jgi:glycosyltransferase involved in cell wall biosynthesis
MKENNRKVLCLFTTGYPYGSKVETFIDSEIERMSELFDKVYIFPTLSDEKSIRQIPHNFEIINLKQNWENRSKRLFLNNMFLIISIVFLEFLNSAKKKTFLKNIRLYKNILVHKLFLSAQLNTIIKEKNLEKAVYYSYWLNDWVIALGILKKKQIIKSFVSRAHSFDIYEEQWPSKTIPFRYFQLKMVDRVFSVSIKGYDYLKNKKIFPEKISYSYLGVPDRGPNPYNKNAIFTIVSCSLIHSRKRVHLIVDVLKNVDFPVKWVHFGDGDLLEEVKKSASHLPANVFVDFKGHVSNNEVFDYYGKKSINLFIILSEMEGLPMSLIEACSFGIPLMGTNVGGVSEIVNENTGILIDKDFDPQVVSTQICHFRESGMNNEQFRNGVRKYWLNNFSANINYNKFYQEIESISSNKNL